jgi:lysophospholipase L1-like esterase
MKVCIIGGSNSVLKDGYLPSMRKALEEKLNEKIEVVNLSMGGTFSHYGLWQISAKQSHLGADVVVVEYALNDVELTSWRIAKQWANVYEGLIAKLRKEVPDAQIVVPLLWNQGNFDTPAFSEINAGVVGINQRYGVTTIDCSQILYEKTIAGEFSPGEELYRDSAHYSQKAHTFIGKEVARSILRGEGKNLRKDILPISKANFLNARSAVKEGLFDKIFSNNFERKIYESSLARESAALVNEGDVIQFGIKGSLIAMIVASIPEDGAVNFTFDKETVNFSLRRRALDDPKFKFLFNICVPDQYYKKTACFSKTLVPLQFKLLSNEEIEANKAQILARRTARLPDKQTHRLAVIDILYDGELVPDYQGTPA